MSVDIYECNMCKEFSALGSDDVMCECGTRYCDDCAEKQIEKYGESDDCCLVECDECTSIKIRDADILEYLLRNADMSREEIESEIIMEREDEKRNSLKVEK